MPALPKQHLDNQVILAATLRRYGRLLMSCNAMEAIEVEGIPENALRFLRDTLVAVQYDAEEGGGPDVHTAVMWHSQLQSLIDSDEFTIDQITSVLLFYFVKLSRRPDCTFDTDAVLTRGFIEQLQSSPYSEGFNIFEK